MNYEQYTQLTTTNFIMVFIVGVIFSAVLYLPIPIIIRFVFKKKYKPMKALWISTLNYIFVKIFIVSMLLGENINFNKAILWLFIGQFILSEIKPNQKEFIKNLTTEELHKEIAKGTKKYKTEIIDLMKKELQYRKEQEKLNPIEKG